ncbi:Uncharacterised protein [Mycobacteroides abscessus subsp. abscessus]|nr:Uncharacterised protein [Mycobacteroides abscessus subsp. abscessus]
MLIKGNNVARGDRVRINATGAVGTVLAAWSAPVTGVPMVAVSVSGHTRRYYGDEITPAPVTAICTSLVQ